MPCALFPEAVQRTRRFTLLRLCLASTTPKVMPPDTLPEWSKGVDSSSTSASCVGSNPTGVTLLLRGLQPPSEAILPGQWTRPDGALLQPEVPATTAVLGRTAGCPRPCPCAEPCQQSDAAWRCCCACRVRCFPKLCSGRVVILCCGRAWRVVECLSEAVPWRLGGSVVWRGGKAGG